MSGLNSFTVPEPVIKMKPKMIIAKPTAIKIILILASVKRLSFSMLFFIFGKLNVYKIISYSDLSEATQIKLLNRKHVVGRHAQILSDSKIRRQC